MQIISDAFLEVKLENIGKTLDSLRNKYVHFQNHKYIHSFILKINE